MCCPGSTDGTEWSWSIWQAPVWPVQTSQGSAKAYHVSEDHELRKLPYEGIYPILYLLHFRASMDYIFTQVYWDASRVVSEVPLNP